ncbi:protein PFC0760c-like [Penaeus monodon]|uniref:protein PFC0760c-like n=1 Tax=Penaeus monodon TaxID=6687 RepID=UPI0018A776F9|nr:protein PFC0760c-like [Penaeus monodon]
MEQKHLHEVVCSFRKNYPHYELEVPLILQTLGLQKINNRKKKISILRKWDKLDPYLQTEELNVMIMKDLLGIDINTGILRFCKGKKFEEFGKISGRDRETKQRIDAQIRNMNNNSIEKTDLTKIKESTNKGNLIIEEVTGNDDKYILDISVSPSHEQSEGQVNENEEEGNEEDSVDQGESSDVDEEDSGDVLHQEEENNDDHVKQLHQDEESNDVDLEKDSHGDNSEDDSGDIIEQIDDSTKNSKDIWGYKSNIVKSEKVGEKILVKRKLIETCHYGGGLIGNKHYKTLPSKIKKSCNMPDPLPARNQKINGSGIAEVRILSLSEHDGVIERCDSIKSDSSEEDFFFRDEAKKKDKQRNLFDSYENPEDSIRMQSKDNRKGYDQDSDIIDTSIYFKRNMYRKVGETENRDQGQESRGSDIDIRGSGRGRLSQRNNNRGNNDSRGRPSWRNNDSRGRPSWRNNDSERSRPSWRNDSIRNKGNFERRGGKWKFR